MALKRYHNRVFDPLTQLQMAREIEIHSDNCSHPSVVTLYGCFKDDEARGNGDISPSVFFF